MIWKDLFEDPKLENVNVNNGITYLLKAEFCNSTKYFRSAELRIL